MTLIVVNDAEVIHSGSVCSGDVTGTVTEGSNSFVTINNTLIVISDGKLEIPTHGNPPCSPSPNMQSHSYDINSLQQSFVTINNKSVILVGDNYSTDLTTITSAGSNNFVRII